MRKKQNDWTSGAAELTGSRFAEFQVGLAKYNAARFQPGLPEDTPPNQLTRESRIAEAEIVFVEALRKAVASRTADIPCNVDRFIEWFEGLKETGPGQGDPLFPWLANEATVEQMTWF